MSAPSYAHERRVAMLDALAIQAGYRRQASFGRLSPDVCRVNRRSLWVGDAKHTETPGNTETYRRWLRYARAAIVLGSASGLYDVLFALCSECHAQRWRAMLVETVLRSGLPLLASGTHVLGPDDQLAWVLSAPLSGAGLTAVDPLLTW